MFLRRAGARGGRSGWTPVPRRAAAALVAALALSALVAAARTRAAPAALRLRHGICIDRQLRRIPPEPTMRIHQEDIRLIKSMGFEFAKVILNPAVLQSGAGVDRSRVWYLDQVLGAAAAERLPVVLCIHPEPEYKRATFGDPDAFARFEAFMGKLARRLASRWTPKQLALQLMTEPFGGGSNPADWNWWDTLQHRLWRTVRAAMPGYTLILSGDRVGQIDGLDDITPVKDALVLYSFTFYEPALFTQQGGPWLPDGLPYLKGLPYPARPEDRVHLADVLGPVPARWRKEIEGRVDQYFAAGWDDRRLAELIQKAVAWRTRHPGTRLWCAEFGCYDAAPAQDRLHYLAALRRLFDENGIGWAYWSYNETFTVMARGRTPFGPAREQTPDRALLRALLGPLTPPDRRQCVVRDAFGRDVTRRGLTLVDWDGQIANPAIRFTVQAPRDTAFPTRATLSADGCRLYFDLPSDVGERGPSKSITFEKPASVVPVRMSIFPDRDGVDEDYTLTIRLEGEQSPTRVPIHVVDQDRPKPLTFHVFLDFSRDRTGFFDDPRTRAIVRQAADDWAYFFADMHLDTVPAGSERTWIWDPDGFVSGRDVTNTTAYCGFLLYAYGISGPDLRSGGEASAAGFQTSQGAPLPLRRSGGFSAETRGNYNTLGWFLTQGDGDWAHTGNLRSQTCDFYSIAHHEIGHALIFHDSQTLFGRAKNAGQLDDPRVMAYLGTAPRIDRFCHLPGAVDPASGRGAFGNEYFGDMPKKRWLITKTDLLVAQAIGYRLRPTSAFAPLTFPPTVLPPARAGAPYRASLRATGGMPAPCWEVVSGRLPPGLALDTFTGAITGSPRRAGRYAFSARVRDGADRGAGITRTLAIEVLPRAAHKH